MKKRILTAAVMAVTLGMAAPSMAVIQINDAVDDTISYATELIVDDVTGTATAITDNNLDVAGTLGFGVANTQTRYIRYDLTNAVLNTATTALDLVVGASTVAQVQGGAAGDDYVIFQITAADDYADSQAVAFGLSNGAGTADGIKVTDKSANVAITYSLYETAADAVNGGTSGRLATQSEDLATFSTTLVLTVTQNTTTADVTTLYTNFVADGTLASDGFVSATLAEIGEVSLDANGTNQTAAGAAAVLGDLVAAGTKLIITGDDLSAASAGDRIYLDDDGTCSAADTTFAGANYTATTVDLVTGATVLAADSICFKANGTTPIEVQSFTVAVDVTAAAGATTADITASALGAFIHDGTVLKAPYFENRTGQGTFLNLSNSSSNDADYTVTCLVANGASTVGTPGTAVADRTTKLNMTALGCPNNTRSVELTLAVPSGSVTGEVVRQNTTTGDSGMDGMVGNQ